MSSLPSLVRFGGHKGSILCATFHGDLLISAGYDQVIRIWKYKDNTNESPCTANLLRERQYSNSSGSSRLSTVVKPLLTILAHDHMISAICTYVDAASKSEFVISASWDKSVKVWNLANGNLVYHFQGHQNRVKCLTIPQIDDSNLHRSALASPSDDDTIRMDSVKKILFSGDDDGVIIGWNLSTGGKIYVLKDHSNFVLHLSCPLLNPSDGAGVDSTFPLLSYSSDQSLRCWQLKIAHAEEKLCSTIIHNRLIKITSVNFYRLEEQELFKFYHSPLNLIFKTVTLKVDSNEILSLFFLTSSDGTVQIINAFSGVVYCEFQIVVTGSDMEDNSSNRLVKVFLVEYVDMSCYFGMRNLANLSSSSNVVSARYRQQVRSSVDTLSGYSNKYAFLYVMNNGDLGYFDSTMQTMDTILQHRVSVVQLYLSHNHPMKFNNSPASLAEPLPSICGATLEELRGVNITSQKMVVYGSDSFMVSISIPISIPVIDHKHTNERNIGVILSAPELPPIAKCINTESTTRSKRVNFSIANTPTESAAPMSTIKIDFTENRGESFWANIDSRQYSFSRLKLYSRSSELVPLPKDLFPTDEGQGGNISRRPKKQGTVAESRVILSRNRPRNLDPLITSK